MKLLIFLLVLFFLSLCNGRFQVPKNVKDAIQAEGNRAGVLKLKKMPEGPPVFGSNFMWSLIEKNVLLINFWNFKNVGRVAGGEPAELGQFPYQALVYMKDETQYHTCGGSLITYKTVLTVK